MSMIELRREYHKQIVENNTDTGVRKLAYPIP